VSANCRYLLTMESAGSLAMFGNPNEYQDPCTDGANEGCRRRRRRLQNVWHYGWSSDTVIGDDAGQSVPKFTMDTDGTLSILEYVSGAESSNALVLWSVSTGISGDDINIEMSDSGCLTVTGGSTSTKWELCSTFTSEPGSYTISGSALETLPQSTTTTTTDGPGFEKEESFGFTLFGNEVVLDWRILFILVVAMLCVMACICAGCTYFRKQRRQSKGTPNRPLRPEGTANANSATMTHAVHTVTETKSLDFSTEMVETKLKDRTQGNGEIL